LELITSFSVLFVVVFLYALGRSEEDWILEYLGDVGFILIGVLMFGTGVQAWTIGTNVIASNLTAGVGNFTNSYGIQMFTIPAANVVGWIFIFIGMILSLTTYISMVRTRKMIEEG
jgi:hypothetical protein